MLNLNNLNSLKVLERGSGGKGFLAKNLTFNAPLTNSLFASGKGSTTPTFTRATTAYVTDYETIPRLALSGEARFTGARRVRNQCLWSQAFNLGTWGRNAISGASTFTGETDPFGTTTAMRMVVDNGSSVVGNDGVGGIVQSINKTALVAQTFVVSFYAKAGEAQELRVRENTSTGYRTVFNLVTGIIAYENSGNAFNYNAQMVSVGNGWWRCQVRYVTSAGAVQSFTFKGCGAGTATTGDGVSGLYMAFMQYEDLTGSQIQVANEYVSTTVLSAPYHGANVDGVKYFSNAQVISQNLIRQSENMSLTWTPTDAFVLTDTGVNAPNGSQSYQVYDTGISSAHRLAQASDCPYPGTSFTLSAYINSGTKNTCVFRLVDSGFTQGGRVRISSISAMTMTEFITGTSTMTSSIVDAGGGWRKVTINVNFPSPPGASMLAMLYLGADESPYVGTGQYVQVTGFHLRQNNTYVSSNYLATTTSALSTVTSSLTIPSTINRGYLSETTATNLFLQSETFDNASWGKTDVTVTVDSNSVLAPNGTATAELLTEGVAGTSSTGQNSGAYTAGSVVTASVYLKLPPTVVNSWVRVMFQDTTTPADLVRVWFNLQTGVVGTVLAGGAATLTSGRITSMGNGWYRCEITILCNALSTSGFFQFMSAPADNNTGRVNNAVYYAWGAQIEVGRGATSYIPTVGATVTRNGDVLTYDGAGNADRLVGTVYSEFTRLIDNGTVGGRVLAYTSASPLIMGGTGLLQSADGTNFPAVATAMSLNTTYKLAMTYGGVTQSLSRGAPSAGTALAQAYDGDFGATATLVSIGTISGSTEPNGCIRNVKIYKVKVSDTQLTALTA